MKRRSTYDFKYPKIVAEMIVDGKTFEELAKIFGMSKQTLVYKLKGESEWTIDEIEKVCIYFGKDYYDLFK